MQHDRQSPIAVTQLAWGVSGVGRGGRTGRRHCPRVNNSHGSALGRWNVYSYCPFYFQISRLVSFEFPLLMIDGILTRSFGEFEWVFSYNRVLLYVAVFWESSTPNARRSKPQSTVSIVSFSSHCFPPSFLSSLLHSTVDWDRNSLSASPAKVLTPKY